MLVCCNGYFLGIEIKAKKGKVSDLQKHQIEQIKKSGGIAFTLFPDEFDVFKNLIEKLLKGKN